MNENAITLMIEDAKGQEHYIALPQTLRRAEVFRGDAAIPHGQPRLKVVICYDGPALFAVPDTEKKVITTPLKPATNLDPLTSLEPQQQLHEDQR